MTDDAPGADDVPAGLAPVAVVLTKVAVPEGLAAACALSKVPVDAVATEIGAVAVCRSTEAGDPERAAQVISQLLQNTPVVLLVQRAGRLTATRWSAGREDEEVPAALMLDGAPPEIEHLLLGGLQVGEIAGAVSSVGMSRWRAMRVLAAAAKVGRGRRG
ncbi:hypothetical protein GXB85_03140 [Cellulomonas sp. APG4]|uniref:hypothetical protein n=1 Tax=Cellulomonas sp. APG4 TaxID=1538656 RepID=UPI00137B5022|nr:hypothetical protein [Cellulomonas sp. APG4]NCT89950.1 hypothetical protein [Cellulomonas sp. APG4]